MLNRDKIRLMTKLAAFEKKEGKEVLQTGEYFRSDYISNRVLLAELHYTLCFILVVMVAMLMRLENILLNLSLQYLRGAARILGIAYVIGLLVTGIISGTEARHHYNTAQALRDFYMEKLEQLLALMRGEQPTEESRYGDDFSEEIRLLRAGVLPEEEEEDVPEENDELHDSPEAQEAVRFAREEASRYLREEKQRQKRRRMKATPKKEQKAQEDDGYWLDDPIDQDADDYWLDAEMENDEEGLPVRRRSAEPEWLDEDWTEGDEE